MTCIAATVLRCVSYEPISIQASVAGRSFEGETSRRNSMRGLFLPGADGACGLHLCVPCSAASDADTLCCGQREGRCFRG